MNTIPTQRENPTGLHQRYAIKKIVKATSEYIESLRIIHETTRPENPMDIRPFVEPEYMYAYVDEGAEYFVMRLDTGGKDIKHIAACRIGIHAYADAIESHLPELAQDLRERYPLI